MAISYPKVRAPGWMLQYFGTAISADITKHVRSITYIDRISHAADEITIELEDSQKFWQGPGFPNLDDRATLFMGYKGESILDCGTFQIDQVELNGPPDVFTLKGISAFVSSAMRTPNTKSYENMTVTQVAQQIGAKYGLNVVGTPADLNVAYDFIAQHQETDVAFLHRIAEENGYFFNVKHQQGADSLVFDSKPKRETVPPVLTLARKLNVERFRFENRTAAIYQSATVNYFDPLSSQLITATSTAPAGSLNLKPNSNNVPVADALKLNRRVINGTQAQSLADAALHDRNLFFATANIVTPGNILMVAGNSVTLSGFGVYDGQYLIQEAHHKLNANAGYSTEIDAYRVPQ